MTGQTQGRAVEVASYDGNGRPTRINAVAADGTIRDSYRYYDELGRLTREVGPQISATDTSRPVSCYVYTALPRPPVRRTIPTFIPPNFPPV